MKHWAHHYIGLDYVEVGRCWGLVQMLCRDRLGIEMPTLGIGTDRDQAVAIRHAAVLHGWHHVSVHPTPHADDIAVMLDGDGERHAGFVVEADGAIGLLHAQGSMLKGGSVTFDPWHELREYGYHSFEYWRRNAGR